jgi:hypothetical protein
MNIPTTYIVIYFSLRPLCIPTASRSEFLLLKLNKLQTDSERKIELGKNISISVRLILYFICDLDFASIFNLWAWHKKTHFHS